MSPAGGCNPVESPCWSRFLAGPVALWRKAPHAGSGLLAGLATPWGTHAGPVCS